MGFDFQKTFGGVKLDGKVVFITGATSGLGFQVAETLVQLGATVYLAARNEQKAAECIKKIEDKLGERAQGKAIYHNLDLAKPQDAKESAKRFIERVDRLDILINNAAMISGKYEMGDNGIQRLMNTNYFSPWILTKTLLPLMQHTATLPESDVRIVNVTSEGHRSVPNTQRFKEKADFNFNHGDTFMKSLKRYGISKLMTVLWTRQLQQTLNTTEFNIIVLTPHPGVVYTAQIVDAMPFSTGVKRRRDSAL